MSKYIIKRILIAIPVLIGITVIDYGIMCLAGSPLAMLQGPRVSEAAKEVREIALGLDKPFYIQYLVWLGQLAGVVPTQPDTPVLSLFTVQRLGELLDSLPA